MRLIRTRLTWYAYLLSGFFTFIISLQGNIIPFLRDEQQLSYGIVSLHPSALAGGMMATGLFTARAVATIGRRWTCLLGLAGCIGGLLAICAAHNAAFSIAGCALVGLTGGMLPGVVGGLLADLHHGSRDQAFTECGAVTYGCAITANLATGVAAGFAFGWRSALLFGVICGLMLAAFFWRDAMPEAPRRRLSAAERVPPASWAYLIMLGLGVALEMTMLLWSPAYLEQVAGFSRSAAVIAAAAFPAAMLFGRSAGSVLVRRTPPTILYPATLCLIAPGFLAYWGGFSAAVTVFGLFVAGLAIALLYPLSLSFAVGAAGSAGAAASARSGLAAGTAVLTAPFALGAMADQVGLSRAYLITPILAAAILLCFVAARAMERRGAYGFSGSLQ
jgi:predicted MFS family arabinose efflux permease